MREKYVHNAQIERTFLGIEDHGFLTAMLTLRWGASGIGWGHYLFGHADKRVETPFGMEFVRQVLCVVGVEKWEDLGGKYIRVRWEDGVGSSTLGQSSTRIEAIGHITEERWFDVKKCSESYKRDTVSV